MSEKIKQIQTIIAFAIMICSCAPGNGQFVPDSPTGKIIGTVVVTGGSYDVISNDTTFYDYVGNNIEAELTRLTDDTMKYNILLKKVCFSNHMPVTIDMTIPAVDIDQKGNLSGDDIVPYAGILGEYPKYTIHDLTGKIVFNAQGQAGALTLDMLCGKYPTHYEGMYIGSEE